MIKYDKMLAKNFFWPGPDTPPQSFFNYCNNCVTGIKERMVSALVC